MRIAVVRPPGERLVERALLMEGIEHEVLRCWDNYSYGRHYFDLWNSGPFVLIEGDIIPWPGAVQALADCPRVWCAHRYPCHLLPEGGANLVAGFGFHKVRPNRPAPDKWRATPWRFLDGEVIQYLNMLAGGVHIHEPPVAHARASVPE